MSPEAQRIAIAEACGWRKVAVFEWRGDVRLPLQYTEINDLPDYLNDLNAIHDAEKTLTRKQWERYYIRTPNFHEFAWELVRTYMRATAAQRAEAFLKTIGKWEDQPRQSPGGSVPCPECGGRFGHYSGCLTAPAPQPEAPETT